MSAALQQSVVDELRPCAGGKAPSPRELGQQLGCSAADLAAAVRSLRYQGKLAWNRLELSPSMLREGSPAVATPPAPLPDLAGEEPALGSAGRAVPAEEDGAGPPLSVATPSSGPDDHDDYPGEVNDRAQSGGFVPRKLLQKAGVHSAITRAAARPVPVPSHEPEVAREVREEVQATMSRRRSALSTATVSHPLELRKFGVADLSFGEGVQSLLAETPHDLMAAISRKHVATWRRIILLSRSRGERPAQALYAALEAGLGALEDQDTQGKAAA